MSVPYCVPTDWHELRQVGGGVALAFYAGGTIRVQHVCDRGDRGIICCAPALQLAGGGHTFDPATVTVSPSILCPDCGLHGFIRESRWYPV